MDLFYDIESGELNQERYENEYPNLREFNECFRKFMEKLYIKEMTYSDFLLMMNFIFIYLIVIVINNLLTYLLKD